MLMLLFFGATKLIPIAFALATMYVGGLAPVTFSVD
jgi:hypothetical protein